MADPRAHVASIESLERFRSALLVFVERAEAALDEVSSEVSRTRGRLQADLRMQWTAEIRRRRQKLEEAQARLLSARISSLGEATHGHHEAVRRAKEAVGEAEDKLRAVKHWSRAYDNTVAPLNKRLGKLDNVLHGDMEKAIRFLGESVRALQDYAELRPGGASRASAAPGAEAVPGEAPGPADEESPGDPPAPQRP